MNHKEKKHFVNESLKELFPKYDFSVDRDVLDIVFQHLKSKDEENYTQTSDKSEKQAIKSDWSDENE